MSAIFIIAKVRAFGGEIALANDQVRIRVPLSVRDETVSQIKAHRDAVILALKREADDPWDAADYRALYEERAAITEFDGGKSRLEAESIAYECLIAEWLDRHPLPSKPGRCAWCHEAEQKNVSFIPPITRAHMHTCLHDSCWENWHRKRRDEAEAALFEMGLHPPDEVDRIPF